MPRIPRAWAPTRANSLTPSTVAPFPPAPSSAPPLAPFDPHLWSNSPVDTTGALNTPRTAVEMCVACMRRSGQPRALPLRTVLCGPCWHALGGHPDASELPPQPEHPVLGPLPHDARSWLRAVTSSAWFRARRHDSATRLRKLLTCLARHANWEDHTTWPTWAQLMQVTGWSRSTMSSWLAQLRMHGWLEHVASGSTPQFRPMALDGVEGNRAAVYRLRLAPTTVPSTVVVTDRSASKTALTRTPTVPNNSCTKRSPVVPTRASSFFHNQDSQSSAPAQTDGPHGPRLDQEQPAFFDHRVPQNAAQQLAAALEIRSDDFALARLSPRAIRSIMKPFWRAGWTNSDLRLALRHVPTSHGIRTADRCPAATLRAPDGWVRHRLGRWRDQLSQSPLRPPSAWESARRRTHTRFGRAGAESLPYGRCGLRPEDLAASDRQRTDARDALAKRRASELAEDREIGRWNEETASQAHERAQRAASRRGETRLPAQPPPAIPGRPGERTSEQQLETWERARALAREVSNASGRFPRIRPGRRR